MYNVVLCKENADSTINLALVHNDFPNIYFSFEEISLITVPSLESEYVFSYTPRYYEYDLANTTLKEIFESNPIFDALTKASTKMFDNLLKQIIVDNLN